MNLEFKKSILVFGGGTLQLSIIKKCKAENFTTIVIDPYENAPGKDLADYFEVIASEDFEGTCLIVDKYQVNGIITAATDKPLVMMARIAKKYNFPFFSVRTAELTTDKFKMKEVFRSASIPHAKGRLIESITPDLSFPAILKPRDNSGSRGVIFCNSFNEAQDVLSEVKNYSSLDSVLYEEFISGKEYSIEAIHTEKESFVIQYTEKITTEFPYNVELGHIAPALLSKDIKLKITDIIIEIALAFNFKNCASHTELKINDNNKICIIETSPRLGGDFITSDLVPLSTSIDIESSLLKLCLGFKLPNHPISSDKNVGIFYFNFSSNKRVKKNINNVLIENQVENIKFTLNPNDIIPQIKSSIDRYGYFILKNENRENLLIEKEILLSKIENLIL